MNPADPLAQLRPLREPAEIGLWPLAPGWWILLLCALALTLAAALWLWRRYRANAYRRQALRQLEALQQQRRPDDNGQGFSTALNALLKATALQVFPPRDVAALHGAAWLDFLCHSAPGNRRLPDSYGTAPYQPGVSPDTENCYDYARHWIRKHRRPQ